MQLPSNENGGKGNPPRKPVERVDIDINALPTLFIQEIAEMKGMIYATAQQVAQLSAKAEGREAGEILQEMSSLADDVTQRMMQHMVERISKGKGKG
jgi:hypothetical protein